MALTIPPKPGVSSLLGSAATSKDKSLPAVRQAAPAKISDQLYRRSARADTASGVSIPVPKSILQADVGLASVQVRALDEAAVYGARALQKALNEANSLGVTAQRKAMLGMEAQQHIISKASALLNAQMYGAVETSSLAQQNAMLSGISPAQTSSGATVAYSAKEYGTGEVGTLSQSTPTQSSKSAGLKAVSSDAKKSDTSLAKLSKVASKLNESTDKLTETAARIDAVLKKLNLGVVGWVDVVRALDEDDNGYRREKLGYAKVFDKWGIALSLEEGNTDEPESFEYQMWLFKDAPRELRLRALGKLPALLGVLSAKAEELTAQIDVELAEAGKLADALEAGCR